jgi:hypothetical protein
MRTWRYERGDWTEVPNPFSSDVNLEQQLERFGFGDTPVLDLGDPDGFYIETYATEESAVALDGFGGTVVEAEFLLTGDTWASWYPVFVADLPSLVQLIGELRPILASEREALDFEEGGRKDRG